MRLHQTRREFLSQVAGVAGGVLAPGLCPRFSFAGPTPPRSRVIIARDEQLGDGRAVEHLELLRKMLDAGMQKLTGTPTAIQAWSQLFNPRERVGIKVNTLGLATQPAVVDAIVAGLRSTGMPAENILIWDRFDIELAQAGFALNKSSGGVQCRGTDAEHYGNGYQSKIESNGQIGSCFSKIVAEQVDALICVPVLKDHNLAGVSLGMKNFFGAIHNPNKYHSHNCDPYVADVVGHRFIRPKWRLTVCDAVAAQYNGGPTRHPGFAWNYGGLIAGTDFVAADAVAADLLTARRREVGLPPLADENRPPKHIITAAQRGYGVADLDSIEIIEI